MDLYDYNYEPNEIDSDQFLSEIPVSLMKENIKVQFEDPLENRKKDHIATFILMYKYSEDNVNVYEDEEEASITEMRDDFYAFMMQMFKDYLSIGFVDFDDMSKDEQDEIIHLTYRFFISNIKKNFVSFILNTIEEERDDYDIPDDPKDITSISFKKEITDPTDIYILSNLRSIIDDILLSDISVDDFFNKCDRTDKCPETRFVEKQFDKYKITGNFVKDYISMVDSDFISEIESKIRNYILKKYNKK